MSVYFPLMLVMMVIIVLLSNNNDFKHAIVTHVFLVNVKSYSHDQFIKGFHPHHVGFFAGLCNIDLVSVLHFLWLQRTDDLQNILFT